MLADTISLLSEFFKERGLVWRGSLMMSTGSWGKDPLGVKTVADWLK